MERLRDLPVAVDLPPRVAAEVTAFVEVDAGWQVVSPAGPPRPVLALASAARPGLPTVVVAEGDPAPELVRTQLLAGALDVVGWPGDRARILDAPLRIRRVERRDTAPRLVAVGGVAGGVGTSTVALALGGLLAWAGGRILVAGGDDLLRLAGLPPWDGPGTAELVALGSEDARREVVTLAQPVAGTEGLAVLGGGGRAVVGAGGPPASTVGWPADAVVVDMGVVGAGPRPDLLVARPDGALRSPLPRELAAAGVPVVVAGAGPVARGALGRLLGVTPVGVLPHSARTARAGLAGRVPSSLPGSWLAALRPAVAAVTAGGAGTVRR